MLTRHQISDLIPHKGALCLLDRVEAWSQHDITCITNPLARDDNPLRRLDGAIGTATLIEVAAQAMALHSRLIAETGTAPRPGFLVSVRDIRLDAPVLNQSGDLKVCVRCLRTNDFSARYDFDILREDLSLIRGGATVLFEVPQ
ncbi:hypothetical protein [Asaia astilbis]